MPASAKPNPKRCPHCGEGATKWGTGKVQRYRCGSCGKTHSDSTGSALSGLRYQEKQEEHAKCMLRGLSIRDTALELGISKDTATRWRYRFLERLEVEQPESLTGKVETDETFFRESFKGQKNLPRKAKKRGEPAKKRGLSKEQIPVLVARDRATGATMTKVVKSRSARDIGKVLMPVLGKDSQLITDGASAYTTLAKKHGFALSVVPADKKHKTSGELHINNVNAYDSRLKKWIARFNGVSTKHLPHYLAWHRWLDKQEGKPSAKDLLNLVKSVKKKAK